MCVCVSSCVCMQEHVGVRRCLLTRDRVCMHVCASDFDYLCTSYHGGFPEHLSLCLQIFLPGALVGNCTLLVFFFL